MDKKFLTFNGIKISLKGAKIMGWEGPIKTNIVLGVGRTHSFSIANNNNISWGDNRWGALGSGLGVLDDVHSPQKVGDSTNFEFIGCGNYFSIAVDTNGNVWSAGYNNIGQLGLGDNENREVFTKINF